jgi:uncharacterized protein (DUF924 family)
MSGAVSPTDIVGFWLEAGPKRWFTKDDAFDREIRERFLATHEAAARGELMDWHREPKGALALVLLFDQLPRNMFRGSPRMYATDPLARSVAEESIASGFDEAVDNELRGFFYLPFTHSEDFGDQARCVALCEATGDAEGVKWARHHRDIVARFGRFPHRNAILGRETTAEEQAYLDADGFKG